MPASSGAMFRALEVMCSKSEEAIASPCRRTAVNGTTSRPIAPSKRTISATASSACAAGWALTWGHRLAMGGGGPQPGIRDARRRGGRFPQDVHAGRE